MTKRKKENEEEAEKVNLGEEFKRRIETVKRIIDTTELFHDDVYNRAVQEHLINEEGEIDSGRLGKKNARKEFANTMANLYIEKAQKHFRLEGEKLDESQEDTLLLAYSGYVRKTLWKIMGDVGTNFSKEVFYRTKEPFMKGLKSRLESVAAENVKSKEDIKEIIKYMNCESMFDPEYMTTEDTVDILTEFKKAEGLSPKYIEALKERSPHLFLEREGVYQKTNKMEEVYKAPREEKGKIHEMYKKQEKPDKKKAA